MRHQCDLTQAAGALVRFEHLAQDGFALGCMRLHHPPALKANLNAGNKRALVGQRLGAGHRALHALAMRRGEDLFRGDVGDARESVAGGRAAAHPHVIVGQANAQIRAGTAEVQRAVATLVQLRGALPQAVIMRAPRRHRIRRIHA